MSLTFQRLDPVRPAEDWLGKPGAEIGGLALSPMALQLIAEAKVAGRRPSGVWVDGIYTRVESGERTLSMRIDPPAGSGRFPSDSWREHQPQPMRAGRPWSADGDDE